ncbi:MAG: WbqC family protein [Limnobacter sp.]|nr:WbqC family protein [Limnobacter sp.]
MQPYFFPYLGHFALIAHTDLWIVFDITQYTPKTYMTRNEVLKASGGRQLFMVELANRSTHIKTCEAQLLHPEKTKTRVLGSLSHYRKRAHYYHQVLDLVHDTFARLAESGTPLSLVELNRLGLAAVCNYLGLPFKHRVASTLHLQLPENLGPGDWAPHISAALGATHYLNPIGGKHLFDPAQFHTLDVTPGFMHYTPLHYATPEFEFEPNLSVLDVLMWNAPEVVKNHLLTDCQIEWER